MPRPLVHYRRQWLIAFLLIGAGVAYWRHYHAPLQIPRLPEPAHTAAAPRVDWFQLVTLPELPTDPDAAARYPGLLLDWFKALYREGFTIHPLSEALETLAAGGTLAERSLVLLFEPGYRVTYEAVNPLLSGMGIPATWVTQDPGRHITDRRFLSNRSRAHMQASGFWEIGMRVPDRDAFVLHDTTPPLLSPRTIEWAPDPGRSGINFRHATAPLHRLHANREWTTTEFIDRLTAELPIRGPATLTARPIQGRLWGTQPLRDDSRPPAFDLVADPHRYLAGVVWLGTAGVPDAEIRLAVRERFGQLGLRLRTDRTRNRRLDIGFFDNQLRIDRRIGDQTVRLLTAPLAAPAGAPLQATITLAGSRLLLRDGSNILADIPDAGIPDSPESACELVTSDILPGAARATGIELQFTPLAP